MMTETVQQIVPYLVVALLVGFVFGWFYSSRAR